MTFLRYSWYPSHYLQHDFPCAHGGRETGEQSNTYDGSKTSSSYCISMLIAERKAEHLAYVHIAHLPYRDGCVLNLPRLES